MSCLRLSAIHVLSVGPIDLQVDPGECLAVAGRSGSGKTLLLRAIADLEPHGGEAYLDDVACQSIAPSLWRRQVGLLPAESQWWYPRVGQHFRDCEPDWLERLGFNKAVMDWEVARCSTGERQRLALLRLLSNRPRALLLDEPTANLDPESAQRAEALLADYCRASAAPALWVTHDAAQSARVARRRYTLETGQLSLVERHA